MGFQVSANRSAWRTYGVQNTTAGPEPWGNTRPALIGLGTRAAPVLDNNRDDIPPEMVDWDWNELEAFASQAQAGSE